MGIKNPSNPDINASCIPSQKDTMILERNYTKNNGSFLYEILRKFMECFKLCCGRIQVRMRSARGGYMKYSANQGRISSFVVGRAGSEYGLPVAVITDKHRPIKDSHPGHFLFRILVLAWMLIHLIFLAPPLSMASEPPIKIAAIFSLTGVGTASSAPSVKGVRFAVNALNHQGGLLGKKIQLMEIDTQSTPIGAAVAAEKAARLGAIAIIGCNWSSHSLAAAKVAQEKGIPMISNISTHPDVTRIGNYIFRVCFTDIVQGRTMAGFARNTLKARTGILFVNLNNEYGIVLAEQFKRSFEASGGSILSRLEYKNNSNLHYFRQLVAQVKQSKPDVVFIPGFSESGVIIREMSKAGVTAIPLGGDGWGFNEFFKAGGSELKQGYFCTHWSPLDTSARSLEYLAHRPDRGKVWSSEVLAVDAVNILAYAIRQAGTATDRSKIRRALSQVHKFKGITGTISFDKNGDPIKDVIIMEIRNGAPHFYTRFPPTPNRDLP